jgi:cyclopropane-fatty-acyl-phospholipid synthase
MDLNTRIFSTGAASDLRSAALEHLVTRYLFDADRPPPARVVLWNGESIGPDDGATVATVHVRDPWVLIEALAGGVLAVGDAFAEGRIEVVGDLPRLLESIFQEQIGKATWIQRLRTAAATVMPWWNGTIERARSNVQHHYDVGNDFYALWLDEAMLYTCAYFETPGTSLEAAQQAKMAHVCRKLLLRPGDRVIEAGCGWGALALYMAERHGVRVRAFNLSSEQIAFAREAAARRGLNDRVEFIEDDWRNAAGRFDAFVSVGMLEHVGLESYETFGRIVERVLTPEGRGLIHTIGRARPMAMNPWLQKRIFPGAHIPAISEMMRVFEPSDLAVLDLENLRPHYARTLEHWLERLETNANRIAGLYDEKLVRTYRLYLAASIAAFETGACQLYQAVFSRAASDALPWTRRYQYDDAALRDQIGSLEEATVVSMPQRNGAAAIPAERA